MALSSRFATLLLGRGVPVLSHTLGFPALLQPCCKTERAAPVYMLLVLSLLQPAGVLGIMGKKKVSTHVLVTSLCLCHWSSIWYKIEVLLCTRGDARWRGTLRARTESQQGFKTSVNGHPMVSGMSKSWTTPCLRPTIRLR